MNRKIAAICLLLFGAVTQVHAKLPADVAAQIAAIGYKVDSPGTARIIAPMHQGLATDIFMRRDLAYGDDPLQKLDVATPTSGGLNRPVLIFVHGGSFTGGDKHRKGDFQNDHLMQFAVHNGMIGVQINYRLAPKNKYPDASNDVAAALKWTKENIGRFGGDPEKIILWGHSAGGALVGIYVSHPEFHIEPGSGLAGAIMTTGIYEFSAYGDYFGTQVAAASSIEGLKKTNVPLLITRAEFDPPELGTGVDKLNRDLCSTGKCPTFIRMGGHNHMSQLFTIGTPERQLSDPVLGFIKEVTTKR